MDIFDEDAGEIWATESEASSDADQSKRYTRDGMNKELEEVKRQHVELKDEVHELEANLKTLEERAAALKVRIQEGLQRSFDITLENKMVSAQSTGKKAKKVLKRTGEKQESKTLANEDSDVSVEEASSKVVPEVSLSAAQLRPTTNPPKRRRSAQSTGKKARQVSNRTGEKQEPTFGKPFSTMYSKDVENPTQLVMELHNNFFQQQPAKTDENLFERLGNHIEGFPNSERKLLTSEDVAGIIYLLRKAWTMSYKIGSDRMNVQQEQDEHDSIHNAVWSFIKFNRPLLQFPNMPTYITYSDYDGTPPTSPKHDRLSGPNTDSNAALETEAAQQHATSPPERSDVGNEDSIADNVLTEQQHATSPPERADVGNEDSVADNVLTEQQHATSPPERSDVGNEDSIADNFLTEWLSLEDFMAEVGDTSTTSTSSYVAYVDEYLDSSREIVRNVLPDYRWDE